MEDSLEIEYFWKLENFCFCELYCNARLDSPTITVRTPVHSQWSLYMFPNGHGPNKDVGIYLHRKRDRGPDRVRVRFKISLQDSRNSLYPPEAPTMEEVFTKDCEWGRNEFVKRSDIATGSEFLCHDILTVVCQMKISEETPTARIRRRQPISQLDEEEEEIKNVSRAFELMHEEALYSDMTIEGKNRTFEAHKCILRARLPQLFSKLRDSPRMVFVDDCITEKFLSYAYTGKLDVRDFTPLNVHRTLVEYGLTDLQEKLISPCNKYRALTYFPLRRLCHTWEIRTALLRETEEIHSTFLSDGFKRTNFSICLCRRVDGDWTVKIRPHSSSNDDVFVRCQILVKDSYDICEHLCRSGAWWSCQTTLQLEDNVLKFNGEFCIFASDVFSIDFVFIYPSGEPISSSLEMTTASRTSFTDCTTENLPQLLVDLEDLYYSQAEADSTIQVGNKEFKEFKVHKCILCARSPFFRAMFKHDMTEKNENLVSLKNEFLDEEIFQEVIDKLLLFTYCGKFEAKSPEFAELLHATIDMYLIGKDYEDS